MNEQIAKDGFLEFMGEVLAAGITKDKLTNLDKNDLLALFPIYFDEGLIGELDKELDDGSGDDDGLGKTPSWIKKIGQFTTDTIKKPTVSITRPLTNTIKVFKPKVGAKLETKLENNKLEKVLNSANQYLVKNPQVAFAIAGAFTGGATLLMTAAIGALAVGQTEYGKRNQQKLANLNERYQNRALIAAETGEAIEAPELYYDGDPQELLKIISSPQFLKDAIANAKSLLITKMGYPDNAQTNLMAQKAAAASIKDIKLKISQGLIKKTPDKETLEKVGMDSTGAPVVAPTNGGKSDILKLAIPAALIAFSTLG